MDALSKLITRLFDIQATHVCIGGEKRVLFKNLGPRAPSNICDTITLPSVCKIQSTEPNNLKFKCPMPFLINNIQQYCLVAFEKNDVTIEINNVKLSSGFPLPILQSNVEGVIYLVSNIKLCGGVPADDKYFPKSFHEEKMSTTYDSNYKVVMRSKFCKQILDWLARNTACTSCHDLHHTRKKREKKRKLEEISEEQNKENKQPCLNTEPVKDTEKNSTTVDQSEQDTFTCTSITLDEEDHDDMEKILNLVSKFDLPEEFVVLLKSQLQNCNKDLDIHQRRWDPKIISLCLTLYVRSPQAYEDLKKSNFLQLPSKRLLQYYKNSVRQIPGFNEANLTWMKKEMEKQNISEFGCHGGIVIDEMTIQDDLIITKSGDTWKLVGYVDMDTTNNNINIISNGQKKVHLATHALQFIFHGFTGFRWPVVYFGANPATAHQLYTTFWKCVEVLGDMNITVDYVMTDGASTNRSFATMLSHRIHENLIGYSETFTSGNMGYATLKYPENLASSIEILEQTSELVDIFCCRNRPISSQEDKRFDILQKALSYFSSWEDAVCACSIQKPNDYGDSNRPQLITHGIYITLQEYAQWEK
ncbi:hypothetical protein FSP39_020263 [Pinctada imbricata]|uniref:Transposable element P transposase-like RNase H domain-containing protein n=1 Tax=Pinctada imbricata TaxID=66713 RepID=A0AA89C241_PINIB|nr:hypothetical protein FSP39_020263 [Pinctada imbricata]